MKKILILTAVGAILTVPAMAVVQCVALDASVVATDTSYGSSDWTAVFPNMTIKGVATCGGTSQTSNQLSDDVLVGDGSNCWCRVISPFITSWVWANEGGLNDPNDCYESCAYLCVNDMRYSSGSSWRTKLYNAIIN